MTKRGGDSAPTVNERSGSRDERPDPVDVPAPAGDAPKPRYALGEEIARGGMGRVVEATDTLLGRRVALKEALSDDADALRRFAREIRITARLEHPSIVPVHDAGTTADGSPFYVMRKVSGRPLEELVIEADGLAQRLALVPHVLAAAQAIAHAHERSVLHRDLKPSNILVGSLGETVVIDWGLAKVIDEPDDDEPAIVPVISAADSLRTRVGTVFGTPGFMSPEQLRGETVDARSDVYALGATLYYVLARRPPHAAPSGDDMMAAALAGPAAPIASLVPGVPAELTTIVDKALAYDDRARYPNAGAFVEDLQRFLTGQLVASHRYSRRERFVRFLKRNRAAVAIGLIAATAIAIAVTLSVRRVVAERNRADQALDDALERNEQLLVMQATSLLLTNPTAAVAAIKPLALSRWHEARAIGLAARAQGVARSYPASRHTSALRMTRDGHHAVSLGVDGVIRVHDLVAHTTRIVTTLDSLNQAGLNGALSDDDRHFVAWTHEHISLVDLQTGKDTVLPSVGRLRDLAVSGDRLWFVADDLKAYTETFSDARPTPIGIDATLRDVTKAKAGPWIGFAGEGGLWVARGTDTPMQVSKQYAAMMDFSDDGKRLVAVVSSSVISVDLSGAAPKVEYTKDINFGYSVAAIRDATYVSGPTGMRKFTPTRPDGYAVPFVDDIIAQAAHGYRRSLIAVTNVGKLYVLGEDVNLALSSPSQIYIVTASSGSPFVVTATAGVLLVYDLSPIIPERLPIPHPIAYTLLGDDHLIVQFVQGPGQWLDLADRTMVDMAIGIEPVSVSGPDTGEIALLTHLDGHSEILRRGVPGSTPVPERVQLSMFASQELALIGTDGGEIIARRAPTFAPEKIYEHVGQMPISISVAAKPQWISTLFADGWLWRRGPSQRNEEIQTKAKLAWSFVRGDGAVFFSIGAELDVWRPDGTIATHATLPRPIELANEVDSEHILAFTDDGAGYDVRMDRPNAVDSRYPPGTRTATSSFSGDLSLTIDGAGVMSAMDPLTSIRWPVARPSHAPIAEGVLAFHGTRMLATSADGILMWTNAFPQSPEATMIFLESLTNARAAVGTAALTWE